MAVLELRNPHSVLAAIERRPHDVIEIRIGGNGPSGAWSEVVNAARTVRIPVVTGRVDDRHSKHGPKFERESAALARVREHPGVAEPGELFARDNDDPGLWLALDCLQDPHNVGAIFRTAAFFGARGVLLSRDRSAPLNGTVYDVATGGVESVPFCQVSNLAHAIEEARESGVWVLGTSEHAELSINAIQPDRPWLLVVGNEERGLRKLTLDKCDQVCAIPPRGAVTSLNVSVATAILIAHLSH